MRAAGRYGLAGLAIGGAVSGIVYGAAFHAIGTLVVLGAICVAAGGALLVFLFTGPRSTVEAGGDERPIVRPLPARRYCPDHGWEPESLRCTCGDGARAAGVHSIGCPARGVRTSPAARYVIRVGDDTPVPMVGAVARWLDSERVEVWWGDRPDGMRVEFADELMPYRVAR